MYCSSEAGRSSCRSACFSWKVSCFSSKMQDFLRGSSWSVEVMRFLLFSPVLLVATLRFMTAYVTPGLIHLFHGLIVLFRSVVPTTSLVSNLILDQPLGSGRSSH